jgi:death-on-curing protein
MTTEKKTFQPLLLNDVCLIYERLHKNNLVSFPLTEEGRNKVEALIATINSEYFGKTIYVSSEERAVAYLYFLIKDHPFTDGNKRTAVVALLILCELNGLELNRKDFPLDALAIFIEKIEEEDHHKVIQTLAKQIFVFLHKHSNSFASESLVDFPHDSR